MTKEEYKELIIDAVKTLKIDYEDFIGYTFSDDPKIWLENIHKIFPDTYTYSKLKKDDERASLVLELYKKLVQAYFKLEKAEAARDLQDELGVDLITFFDNYRELKSMKGRNLRLSIEEIEKELGKKAKKIETTKKDLEILDILKKKIYIISETKDSGGTVLAETIGFSLNNVDKDYTKIKEWLENDK